MSTESRDAEDWRTKPPDGGARDAIHGLTRFCFFVVFLFFLIDPYARIR
jgi:hypothetical protein